MREAGHDLSSESEDEDFDEIIDPVTDEQVDQALRTIRNHKHKKK